jgi:hypothetical protein
LGLLLDGGKIILSAGLLHYLSNHQNIISVLNGKGVNGASNQIMERKSSFQEDGKMRNVAAAIQL